MFYFILLRRKIIIYAKPSKKLRITNSNKHAVPVQCPWQAVQSPAEQQPSNPQPTKIKSLKHLSQNQEHRLQIFFQAVIWKRMKGVYSAQTFEIL